MNDPLTILGAITSIIIYVTSSLVFSARLLGKWRWGQWFGVGFLLCAFPLAYLLITAPANSRPPLYYIQVGLMLIGIVVIFLIDYVLKIEFRQNRPQAIAFVILYFAGLGGMLGVAALAGQPWTIIAIVLFFITAILAFVQRAVTGL